MVGQTYAVMLGPYHTQPGCEVVPTSGFGSRAELWETQRKAFAFASNSIAFNFFLTSWQMFCLDPQVHSSGHSCSHQEDDHDNLSQNLGIWDTELGTQIAGVEA